MINWLNCDLCCREFFNFMYMYFLYYNIILDFFEIMKNVWCYKFYVIYFDYFFFENSFMLIIILIVYQIIQDNWYILYINIFF